MEKEIEKLKQDIKVLTIRLDKTIEIFSQKIKELGGEHTHLLLAAILEKEQETLNAK